MILEHNLDKVDWTQLNANSYNVKPGTANGCPPSVNLPTWFLPTSTTTTTTTTAAAAAAATTANNTINLLMHCYN